MQVLIFLNILRDMGSKSLFWYISKTARILSHRYADALHPLGLNCAQANVILVLAEFEEQNKSPMQNELAEKSFSDKVSLHSLLKKLEKMEYVILKKDPVDNRCNFVSLSIKGRYLIPRIRIVDDLISSYFAKQFETRDFEKIALSLGKFIKEESE